MFTGIAVAVGSSAAAPWKFGLILLAAVNVAVFHDGPYRTVEAWDLHVRAPWGGAPLRCCPPSHGPACWRQDGSLLMFEHPVPGTHWHNACVPMNGFHEWHVTRSETFFPSLR
jgi:hypothetical protein